MRAARWCAALAALTLVLGGGTAAAEPRSDTGEVGVAALPSSFSWSSSGVLISPKSDATHNILAVKDPTVVRYNNNWHVFASTARAAEVLGFRAAEDFDAGMREFASAPLRP